MYTPIIARSLSAKGGVTTKQSRLIEIASPLRGRNDRPKAAGKEK